MRRPDVACGLLAVLVLLLLLQGIHAYAVSTYNLQVGAYGDQASIGNEGVRAEIRTNTYHVNTPDEDSFWVGSILSNGAFIQFGYIIEHAGSYCSNSTVMIDKSITCYGDYLTVDGSQALLFWAYSPSNSDVLFYYGLTRLVSVDVNATWHLYSIVPNRRGGWAFFVDDKYVANALFPVTKSSDRVFIVAEKAFQSSQTTVSTGPPTLGLLGPVEFQNAAYLKDDSWYPATELYAVVNCGVNPNCPPIPYGVSLVGPNHIIAGTSINKPNDKQLLWSRAPVITSNRAEHTILIVVGSVLVMAILTVAVIILLRKLSRSRRNRFSSFPLWDKEYKAN